MRTPIVDDQRFIRDDGGQDLLEAQRDVLEMIIRGRPLPAVLEALCGIVEAQAELHVRAAILLADAAFERLWTGAAPSLPDDYNRAVDGIAIAADVGTCSAAAARNEVVITLDIETSPGWAQLKHLPLGLGLRAAWSMPIRSSTGAVLGTFGTYFSEPRVPTAHERRLVEVLVRTAALAIERQRGDDALREREARLRAFTNATFDVVYRMSPDWSELSLLEGRDFLADTLEPSRSWLEKYIHPDDQPLVLAAIKRGIQARSTFELEHRVIRADGTLGWTHSRTIPIFDARGEIVEWFGAASDVTPRKDAEAAAEQRAAQHAAIAALGQTALAETSIDDLMDQAVQCVAHTLHTELAKVQELAPNGGKLVLRAGVGWKPGLVGRAMVGAGRDSQAGFTLLADEPVVVTDLRTETRFTGGPLLLDHDVVSGVTCVIRGPDGRPYGVLGTHTRCRREFSEDEANFLRCVANVLAAAIVRRRAEEALVEAESHAVAESVALARLNELSSRLWQMAGLNEGLKEMLHATIALLGADMGDIQLMEGGVLRIVAQQGLAPAFLDHLWEVTVEDGSACARALCSGAVVMIEDVETDEGYAPLRPVAREAGYRAVISAPLIDRDRGTLGVVSVHFKSPHRWSDPDLQRLRLYLRRAAGFIERCRVEGELRNSEERYRRLAEQLHLVTDTMAAPVSLCSRDLRYVWVSRPYAEWLGRSPEEIEGRPIVEIVGPEVFDKVLTHVQTVLSGQEVRYEEEVQLPGLGRRWISVVNTPTFDAAGAPDGWVGVVIDTTERKRSEQALRESAARQAFLVRLDNALRPLADAGAIQNAAALVLGEHLRVARVLYADVEGEPGAEMGTVRSRYHGPDGQALAPFPERYAFGDFGERLTALRRRGRTTVVADVNTDPAFDAPERATWAANGIRATISVPLVKIGRLVAVLGVQSAAPRSWTAQEIALARATAERTWAAVERARAEAALRESEERFHTLADNMDQLAWIANPAGALLWFNKRWHDYTAATLEDVGASNSQVVHPEHADRVAERSGRGLRQGEAWEDTFPLKGRTGEYRWFLRRAVPIKDDEGKLLRWFGTLTDITEIEQRNAQLRRLSAQLTEIEQRERSKLANTLHDGLQQLIVAARLRLPRCLEENGSDQVQRIDRLLDEAIEAVRSLAWELSPPGLAISTLPEALEWLADWFHTQHGFDLSIVAAEAIPPLPEHAKSFLFGAVRELLLNCVKHSGVAAATLELRTNAAHELQVVVADDGLGFDPAKVTYGYGLSNIRERLVALGGRLVVESAPGAGARFTMSLPLPNAQTP